MSTTSAPTMLYVTENKRKALAGVIAAVLTLAIGFGIGRLTASSSPDLTSQLAAARQMVARQHAATLALRGRLTGAHGTIVQLRSTIGSQHSTIARERARIRTFDRQRRPGTHRATRQR